MKKNNVVIVLIFLGSLSSLQGSFSDGVSQIWQGAKEATRSTWNGITSLFKSEKKSVTDDKNKKTEKKAVQANRSVYVAPKQLDKKICSSRLLKK